MKVLQVDILTPEEKLFSGEAVAVTVPGADGSFQVLYNHAPIISSLAKGKIKVKKEDGQIEVFEAVNGIVEVNKNKVILLVEGVIE